MHIFRHFITVLVGIIVIPIVEKQLFLKFTSNDFIEVIVTILFTATISAFVDLVIYEKESRKNANINN